MNFVHSTASVSSPNQTFVEFGKYQGAEAQTKYDTQVVCLFKTDMYVEKVCKQSLEKKIIDS